MSELRHITSRKIRKLPQDLIDEYQPYLDGYAAQQEYTDAKVTYFLMPIGRFLSYVRDEGLPVSRV